MKINITIVDKIISELSEIENLLITELKSLTTKEEIEKINKEHAERQSKNEEKYQAMLQ